MLRFATPFVLSLAATVGAQGVSAPQGLAEHPAQAFAIPIHETAVPGGTEVWAGGADFKVSFHDGFAFYPVLGESYARNLPLRWRTTSVTAGGTEVLDRTWMRGVRRSGKRYEYDFGGVVEAYDLRSNGVEQTFTIRRRLGKGDLVVTGRIDSELTAERCAARQQALTFRGPKGGALVHYGKAIVLDAVGRRAAVTTSFDGERVRLTVPGAWLQHAAYPVTIDPLIGRSLIHMQSTRGPVLMTAVGFDGESSKNNTVTVLVRRFTSTDSDVYAYITNADFTYPRPIFADLTKLSVSHGSVAHVAGADKWVIAFDRAQGSGPGHLNFYLHASGNTKLGSGLVLTTSSSSLVSQSRPAVGGTAAYSTGDKALVVFEQKPLTTQSDIYAILVDCRYARLGKAFPIPKNRSGTLLHRCQPHVNQISAGGSSSWVTVWAEHGLIFNDDYDIEAARVTPAGVVAGYSQLGVPTHNRSRHRFLPRVAGQDGRYLATFVRSNNLPTGGFGREIAVHRFDWSEKATQATRLDLRTVYQSGASNDAWNSDAAYHSENECQFGLVYQTTKKIEVRRLSRNALTIETAKTSMGTDVHPSITFNDRDEEFQVVYANNQTTHYPAYGSRLRHDPDLGNRYHGTRCGTGLISADKPYASLENWRVSLSSAPAGQTSLLFVATTPTRISLNVAGMTGCMMNVGPSFAFVLGNKTNSRGQCSFQFALPPAVAKFDLYTQWAYEDARAVGPTKISATRGLVSRIRP